MKLLRTFITKTILLIGVAALAAAWPGATSTARATEPSWLTVPGGLPLFDLDGIAPGHTGSATFTVTNPQSFPVTFSLAVTGLANDDNGCNEPEQVIGDTTCGAGGGELQLDLRLTLTATGQTDTPIAAATVAEWATQPAIDPVALSDHETRTYRIGYELPITSTNMTQSDLVAFQLEMRLDQQFGSEAPEPPAAVIAATTPLPRTGSDTKTITMIGLAAILAGLGLYKLSTQRRRFS